MSVLIPTLKDPLLAPIGEHLVILKTISPRRAAGGDTLAERMLELAETVVPGLREHLTYVDSTGAGPDPRLHPLGPYSGWALTPEQSGVRRLAQQTPLAGLLLAGQWTQPGLGVWTVVQSGVAAARFVLEARTSAPVLPLLV